LAEYLSNNKLIQEKKIVTHTFVNGNLVYNNGTFNEAQKGMALAVAKNL